MNAAEFIQSRISTIKALIPQIKVEYQWDNTTSFHVIIVESREEYVKEPTYVEWEYWLWKRFRALYPNEDLSIED